MLPFAIGACEVNGGNIFTDAFGIVALVAMTPVLTIQCFGLFHRIKARRMEKEDMLPVAEDSIIMYDEMEAGIGQFGPNNGDENRAELGPDLPEDRGMEG
jgi:hypothetical protein